VAGADVEKAIVARVKALFETHAITQRELADAIGTSPSWVSAFFANRRPANDIHLLLRIARYFGVSVGYLLNESERGRDAETATLLAAFDGLLQPDRAVVLNVALSLKRRGEPATGGLADTPAAAPETPNGRNGKARKPPPSPTNRTR
jgi:transcriptional regulator with XRE-family HTH domain